MNADVASADVPDNSSAVTRRWRSWSTAERVVVAIAVVAAIAGIFQATVRAFHAGWVPVSDDAAIALRTHDVFSARIPLVGMPSTLGSYAKGHPASHLGPLEFFALAPFYALFQRSPSGLLVGAAAINVSAVLAIAWASARLGGARLAAFAMALVALLELALGPLVAEVWNPDVALLPFAAFVVLSVVVASGTYQALPAALLFGSFALQAHLSYLGIAGAGLLWVTVLAVWHAATVARRTPRAVAGTAALGVGAAVLCWWAPIAQQLTGTRPNLSAVADGFTAPSTSAGLGFAIRSIGNVIGAPPPFGMRATSKLSLDAGGATLGSALLYLIPWVALVAGAVVAWRRRARAALGAFATGAVVLAAATITAARAPTANGVLFTYNVRWLWPAAFGVWFAVAAGVFALLTARRATPSRHAAVRVAAAWCAVAVVVACWPRAGITQADRAAMRLTGRLVAPALDAVHPGGTYVVRGLGAVGSVTAAPGLAVALERRGVHVYIGVARRPAISPWGAHRLYTGQRVDGTLWVVSGAEKPPSPTARRIARCSGASATMIRQATSRRVAAARALGLDRAGGVDVAGTAVEPVRFVHSPTTAAEFEWARHAAGVAIDDDSLLAVARARLPGLTGAARRDVERYLTYEDLVSQQWAATIWLDTPPG